MSSIGEIILIKSKLRENKFDYGEILDPNRFFAPAELELPESYFSKNKANQI